MFYKIEKGREMDDVTIRVKDLTKAYKLYEKPTDRIKESLFSDRCFHRDFLAVNHVSFEVNRGETVGIIGRNGAGKSTLLKLITGVLTPTSGEISLSGKVSALLELGTGFDSERNGIENIYLNGRIHGLSKKEIEKSVDEILEFADIGEFIYQPLKTYSSGMLVRLAFAVAVTIQPEILIVDEALSVGDVRFQQKCYRKIREFKESGTVLFVSHDTGAIASFCDRVIWLEKGEIYKSGEPNAMIEEYLAFMRYEVTADNIVEKESRQGDSSEYDGLTTEDNTYLYENRKKGLEFGNQKGYFEKISLLDERGNLLYSVKGGQEIVLDLFFRVMEEIEFPILGFNVKDDLGNELIVSNTVFEKIRLERMESGKRYHFQWRMKFPEFHQGSYPVDIALAEGTYLSHEQVHFVTDAVILKCMDERDYQEGRGRVVPFGIRLVQMGE